MAGQSTQTECVTRVISLLIWRLRFVSEWQWGIERL